MRFRWRNRKTGEALSKVRIEHTLTIDDVALILVLNDSYNDPGLDTMTLDDIDRAVREFLYWRGRDVLWTWRDSRDEDDEIEERAAELVPDLCDRFGIPEPPRE